MACCYPSSEGMPDNCILFKLRCGRKNGNDVVSLLIAVCKFFQDVMIFLTSSLKNVDFFIALIDKWLYLCVPHFWGMQ